MGFWSFLAQLLRDAGASAPGGSAAIPAPPLAIGPSPSYVASEPLPITIIPAASQFQMPLPAIAPPPTEPEWLSICRPLTQHFEACYLIAYCDPASQMGKALQAAGLWYKYLADRSVATTGNFDNMDGRPWTVGYGATQNGIGRSTRWTKDQADADLTRRLLAVGISVDQLVSVKLLPHQKAAIADFAYNEGEGRLATSTMLRCLNTNNFSQAMIELLEFNLAGGKKLEGLVHRREADKSLFESGTWQA